MYINKGFVCGSIAGEPKKVAQGVVLLTVRVRDDRINPTTKRREFHFPNFVVFGYEADKAMQYLDRNQEVGIEYKVETRRKEINGEKRSFTDLVVVDIQYGRKSQTIKPEQKVEKINRTKNEEIDDIEPVTQNDKSLFGVNSKYDTEEVSEAL